MNLVGYFEVSQFEEVVGEVVVSLLLWLIQVAFSA